ncbi:MAG TPA: hypothetical protein VL463_32925 [Kofleriaceae bacterium]|nr:hypothetical protein [Kofleriaceae bacterium]
MTDPAPKDRRLTIWTIVLVVLLAFMLAAALGWLDELDAGCRSMHGKLFG